MVTPACVHRTNPTKISGKGGAKPHTVSNPRGVLDGSASERHTPHNPTTMKLQQTQKYLQLHYRRWTGLQKTADDHHLPQDRNGRYHTYARYACTPDCVWKPLFCAQNEIFHPTNNDLDHPKTVLHIYFSIERNHDITVSMRDAVKPTWRKRGSRPR